MGTLHFFGGEKGGVGKSFVARTAAQYHLDRGLDFSLFDADRSAADVKRTYQNAGCREAIFSESKKFENGANSVYLEAKRKTTLVNLPPQIGIPFKDWLEDNDVFDLAKEDGVSITHWFVCSGELGSVRLFGEYLSHFQEKINHVLVKNLRHCKDWELLEKNDFIQQKITDYDIKIVDFPKFLGQNTLYKISQKGLTFGEAKEDQEFHPLYRSQIKTFLDEAYQEFDKSGVFDDKVNQEAVVND